jgi:hypothetical protein
MSRLVDILVHRIENRKMTKKQWDLLELISPSINPTSFERLCYSLIEGIENN